MSANTPILEPALGVKDGVNTVFGTNASYVTNTLFVYINGQLQSKDFIVELTNTTFSVEYPPLAEDIVIVRYLSVI
jgi:hypothetical protein